MNDLSIFRNGTTVPRPINTQEGGLNGKRELNLSSRKKRVTTGNVNKPGKSELDPPLAEGEMDRSATFFLYTHAPPTTHAP